MLEITIPSINFPREMVVGTAKAISKGTTAHPPNINNIHESFQEAGVNMGVDRYLQLKQ